MTRRNVIFAAAVILSLVIASFGVYRQVDGRRGPAPAASPVQRELVPAPLTVSLSTPGDRRTAVVGVSTFLAVNVAGEEISAIRVYDGSALVGVQQFSPHRTGRVSVQVEWPAVRAGSHVLHAEAVGAGPDQVGHSAPVRLKAVPAVVPATSVQIPGNGRTPVELAAATGVDPAAVKYAGADGRTVSRPPITRPLADGVTATVRLDRLDDGPRSLPVGEPRRAQTEVVAALDGCTASVSIANGRADEVSVYELTGGSAGFTLRGTATTDAPYTTGELTPGTHVFVAGPGDEPADSPPVAVEVPATCLADAWSGPATIFDGELTLPKPEPQVWVYLGVDGEPFRRVPAEGSVSAAFGTADLAGALPTLTGSKIRMEVWRAGATPDAPATRVARSELSVADATIVPDLLGTSAGITLTAVGGQNPVELAATATAVRFSWQTESLLTEGVIWQVLGRPLSAGDHNTAPPVLLATGSSAAGADGSVSLSGTGGGFSVPAELLLGGRPADGKTVADVLAAIPTPTIQQLVKPGSSFGTTPVKAPEAGEIPALDAGIVPVPIGDVYVRVLPIAGQSVIGDASNTVAVTLPPLSPTTAGFKDAEVTFDPGRAANYELGNCIRVTGTPASGAPSFSLYKSDRTYCPGDFPKKGGGCQGWCQIVEDFSSLVSFVAEVWDYIAYAYNTVVETLITIIAKFNPYCLSASAAAAISESSYADSAAEGCEAVAKVVASVVVSVVLSSFGLPARLPTSDQLGAIVEGDLTAIAVAYLEQLGVPCSQMTVDPNTVSAADRAGIPVPDEARTPAGDVDVCAAMISQAVGAIRTEIKKTADAELANTTGMIVPAEPQLAVREPRGQYLGAEVRVSATPIDAKTLKSARCPVLAHGTVPEVDRGYEGIFVRQIGNGYGNVAYNPLSAVGFGKPWRATLRMRPIDTLNSTETIAVTLTSPCFAANSLPSVTPTPLRPVLGYWYPGQPE